MSELAETQRTTPRPSGRNIRRNRFGGILSTIIAIIIIAIIIWLIIEFLFPHS